MAMHQILGILSAIVFISGSIPYIIAILRGTAKPHPFSWALWAIIGAITFFFSIKLGARETLPLAFFNFFDPFVIALLSIKYWKGGFSRFEYVCLSISAFSILVFIVTHSAAVSLSVNLVADIFAYLPTLRKTYRHPQSEDFSSWALFLVGYLLSVAAITKWTYGVAVFPVYLSIFGIIMLILISRKRLKSNN